MRLTHILIGVVGVALVLWGLLGVWAATLPEEGAPTDDFWRSGLLEIALGGSLVILALLIRRRVKGQQG